MTKILSDEFGAWRVRPTAKEASLRAAQEASGEMKAGKREEPPFIKPTPGNFKDVLDNLGSERPAMMIDADEEFDPTRDTLLGKDTAIPKSPHECILCSVPNPHPDTWYIARFTCPEFTSLCPATGQPDFATIIIDYAPAKFLVESKSLKYFLFSFRNHGAFHEDCAVTIGKHFLEAVKPRWIRLAAYFAPRGGIPIDVFFENGIVPDGCAEPPIMDRPYQLR